VADLCYLCLAAPSGPHATGYGFKVCAACWRRAEHGWEKQFEASIFDALTRASLLIPDRTASGRLPREYVPPADFSL